MNVVHTILRIKKRLFGPAPAPDDFTGRNMFQRLLGTLNDQVFQVRNFRRTRSTFYRWLDADVCQVLNFQKSKYCIRASVKFTANLGVYYRCLRSVSGVWDDPKRRHPLDCHYRERIGFLGSNPSDKWWTLDQYERIDDVINELRLLIDVAIQKLDSIGTAKTLYSALRDGTIRGLTDRMRQDYLRVLEERQGDE